MAKYSAKKVNDNQYAVCSGAKYFTATLTDCEEYAKQQALIMSLQYHDAQVQKLWGELKKSAGDRVDYKGIQLLNDSGEVSIHTTELGDLLC